MARNLSLEFFRRRLADIDALPQLAFLSVIAGTLTGLVMLVFRGVLEMATALITGGDGESFNRIDPHWRVALPMLGAFTVGFVFTRLAPAERRVGVVHVMERLSSHQGYLPLKNAVAQFFGGAIALSTGVSGGREGPAVHLGAAASSLLGRALELPNNSIRTLVACGTAAAIAASFNTPMAGVIFAMEVVMMEYTIASFVPVILASVTATVISRYGFGNEAVFTVPAFQLESLMELPFIAAAGIVVGVVGAAFIAAIQFFAKLSHWPFWLRLTVAGALTGGVALAVPDVMGPGYESVNSAMLGQVGWVFLLVIVVAKTITSAASVGLGVPVGLIGPTLVVGAGLGGVLGYLGNLLVPESSSPALYVMLGMTAMMAAVLQAPLAALLAVVELTANPSIILPAMLIIVVATMTVSQLFKQRSVYLMTLSTLGLEYPPSPTSQHMLRAGIATLMQREFVRLSERLQVSTARLAMQSEPRWVVVEGGDGQVRCLMEAVDLRHHLDGLDGDPDDAELSLMQLPASRKDVQSLDIRATVHEAMEALDRSGVGALCIHRASAQEISPIMGVVTREDVDAYARYGVPSADDSR